MKKLFLITILFAFKSLYSQNGTIRGTVIEDESGETVIGANVAILNPLTGTSTDLDGKFSISIAPGTYTMQVSYISFQKTTIEGVEVKSGEVTSIGNIRMKSSALALEEVVVTATATRKSEAALNTMKKKSATMMDGISAQKMALTGDGTAIEAAQRVTGVSIEGGKYIYVRGLGDRYSKVTLNGVDIPGLDPDRNSLQMDIFPTNLIDNIVVSKNFTAELPADFAGGVLNVETKSFPDEKIFNVSVGTSYIPGMTFNSDYLSYEGGNTDWLGFDDGTRSIPAGGRSDDVPTPLNGSSDDEVNSFVRSFSPTLGAETQNNFLNFDASITYGNQIDLSSTRKLGYILSLSYKNNYRYFDDVVYGEYQRLSDSSEYEMVQANLQEGSIGLRNVLVGGLAGLAYKGLNSKVRLTLMHLQNGESRAGQFRILNDPQAVGQSGFLAESDNLEYSQRGLTNLLLNGTHVLDDLEIDWRLSPTLSTADDPDIRKTAYTFEPTDTFFAAGAGGLPSRIWRELEEINLVGKVDLTKKYKLLGEDAKLKFGGAYVYKERDYEITQFDMQFWRNQQWPSPDPSTVLDPINIYPNDPNGIYYQSGNSTPNPNQYNSNITNIAAYISNEMQLTPLLKTILGIRMENYVQRHTGRDQSFASGNTETGKNLDNDIVLESTDFFPSVNFIYTVAEEQNLRFAYARTIARPSFKELSFAQIIDPLTNRIFNGSLFEYSDWDGNLVETRIDNIDLRWELFMERGQIYSISAFYKSFDRPIELVRIPEQQTTAEFQPRNVGRGQLLGLELEATKSLDFISSKLEKLSFSGNVTLVTSEVIMSDREFNSRKQFERDDEDVDNRRPMAGQAPFVINAGFTFNDLEKGLQAGVFYNVKGPTLEVVGVGLIPDVYQIPFHSINLSINKKLGKEQNTLVDFKVSNLLNDKRESFFRSFEAEDQIFSSFSPGVEIGIGISHKF